jgi:hypothetical protein
MSKTVFYSVVISRKDDPDGITGVDLNVSEDYLPELIDMVCYKDHKIEINGIEEVEN